MYVITVPYVLGLFLAWTLSELNFEDLTYRLVLTLYSSL